MKKEEITKHLKGVPMITVLKIIILILTGILAVLTVVFYVLFGASAVLTGTILLFTAAAALASMAVYYKKIFFLVKKAGSGTGIWRIGSFIVIMALLGFIYLISDSAPYRIDLTSSGLYSLSEQSRSVLKGITNDVNVYFFKPAGQSQGGIAYIENLLKVYTTANPHLRLHRIDPLVNRAMAVDYNVTEEVMVIFEYQGNKVSLGVSKMMEADPSTGKAIFKGEQAFTGALKSLMLSKPKNILVVTGHGEINAMDNSDLGYSFIFEKIRGENAVISSVNLVTFPDIPADTSLLILGNPINPISIDEMDKIKRYMDNGGSVLVFLNYRADVTISDVLREMGLFYIRNLVVEKDENRFDRQNGNLWLIPDLLPGDITSPLIRNALHVILPYASGILQLGLEDVPGSSNYNYERVPLMKTSDSDSFGVVSSSEIESGMIKENRKTDLKGPFVLGYSVKRQPRASSGLNESRLVVLGSTDFIINKFLLNIMGANSDIVLNSIDFLLKRDADITIRTKTSNVAGFELTSMARRLLAIFAFAVAVLYMIPGIVIIINRRSRIKTARTEKNEQTK